jgi:peptide/nickel transport system permease protein
MNPGGGVDQKAVEELRVKTGLNEPVYIHYINWMGKILQGNFGQSYMTGEAVSETILRCFIVTLKLAIISMLISIILAIPPGIISALKKEQSLMTSTGFLRLQESPCPISGRPIS